MHSLQNLFEKNPTKTLLYFCHYKYLDHRFLQLEEKTKTKARTKKYVYDEGHGMPLYNTIERGILTWQLWVEELSIHPPIHPT